MSSEEKCKSFDSIFRALADEDRRCILAYLSENEVATMTELIDYLSTECSITHDREQAATHLHHANLPKLEETSLVEYDSRSKTVRYYQEPVVEKLLEYMEEQGEEVAWD